MSKRLTDTDKWDDEWFQSLSNDYKIIWLYLLDKCNHAGIIKKNIRLLNFNCNTKITEPDIQTTFTDRVMILGNYFFIPKFLLFQYENMNSKRPVVASAITLLEKHDLLIKAKQVIPHAFGFAQSVKQSKSLPQLFESDNQINIWTCELSFLAEDKSWFEQNILMKFNSFNEGEILNLLEQYLLSLQKGNWEGDLKMCRAGFQKWMNTCTENKKVKQNKSSQNKKVKNDYSDYDYSQDKSSL